MTKKMNRRDFVKTGFAAGMAATVPVRAFGSLRWDREASEQDALGRNASRRHYKRCPPIPYCAVRPAIR